MKIIIGVMVMVTVLSGSLYAVSQQKVWPKSVNQSGRQLSFMNHNYPECNSQD